MTEAERIYGATLNALGTPTGAELAVIQADLDAEHAAADRAHHRAAVTFIIFWSLAAASTSLAVAAAVTRLPALSGPWAFLAVYGLLLCACAQAVGSATTRRYGHRRGRR